MRVTFPHMGNQYVATKVLLDELQVDLVLPPPCSQETLAIGVKYAPESICLPLKVNIGNYVESIRQGADTVVITGSCGPCRFGYYSVLEQEILSQLGHSVQFILLDPPRGDYNRFFNRIFQLTQTRNPYKILKAMSRATHVLFLVDQLEQLAYYKRPRQKQAGRVDELLDRFKGQLPQALGYAQVKALLQETRSEMLAIEEEPGRQILKMGLIGEIYTLNEPLVNFSIERKLGEMGVELDKSLKISRWLVDHLYLSPLKLSLERKIYQEAKPYLASMIGGHARETVGYGVHFAKAGFDGLVQVYPFTCMPEIVAQSILPQVEKDYDIPYLCLIVDELTGEAGYATRLEAFVDLVRRRKEQQYGSKLLSGY